VEYCASRIILLSCILVYSVHDNYLIIGVGVGVGVGVGAGVGVGLTLGARSLLLLLVERFRLLPESPSSLIEFIKPNNPRIARAGSALTISFLPSEGLLD
jgi:hypothetical protein